MSESEKGIEVVEEKVYTFSFRKAWITPRGKRAPRVIRMLKDFVKRHTKSEEVLISNEINELIWARGIQKPPRKLRIKVIKDKEGKTIVYPV
ncbi:MAG: 50S ribosomal protein L31e [Candidatus Bathyarchaeia archaeon]